MTLLIVTYPVNNNALTSLFIARHALNLSCSIVVISYHFTVRISHRLHAVPAVIRSTIDISPDIRHTRHDRTDGLRHLTLSAIVIGFTTRSILNEGKTTGTVILIAGFTIGISNTVEEIFRIEHLMQPFEIVGVRDVTLVRYRLPKLCRELRQEVARRIVSHVRLTSIRMVHHQFPTKQVVGILRLPAVRMLDGHHLSDRVVAILHRDILTTGMLHRFPVASLGIGIALRMSSQCIRDRCLEHRFSVMAADSISRTCHTAVSKRNTRGTVMRIILRLCLQITCSMVVSADVTITLRHWVISRNITSEGIDDSPSTDNRDLLIAAAGPHHARLFRLDGTHQRVGKGISVNVPLLGIMDGMCLTFCREVLKADSKRLTALYLIRSTDSHLSAQCIIGVFHLLPVKVGRYRRSIPKTIISRAGAVAVRILDTCHKTVITVVIRISIEHTLMVIVLRLRHACDVAIAIVGHVIDRRLVTVMEHDLRYLTVPVHLRAALTVSPAATADGDMARNTDNILIGNPMIVDVCL
ncbi:hypothetical protein HMPREF9141_2862 [Prevotella multiformis DSM 16608]|uniref:Uncharacterized protein n=1 Tax=Prevotella multiformis DSM 16608 TaxID=888743 RepID=F0FB95_9BACT|nr:hypothetical protein HMPREF9141_2862 [Prevotella multiformis DSM 16608]